MSFRPPKLPHVEWKTRAVTGVDAAAFAKDLALALQEMTDSGFTIVSQVMRGDAIIITGQRVESMQEPQAMFSVSPATSTRRRIVDYPTGEAAGVSKEVLYHYIENGQPQQRSFHDVVDALRLVQAHLAAPSVPYSSTAAGVIPVRITAVELRVFELRSFPALLKAFADELRNKPSEPVG